MRIPTQRAFASRKMSILTCVLWLASAFWAAAADSRQVVVVVWDGMRPDFVNEANTPALWKLAKGGVVFRNHHAVYPSATNVNGTALATGVYPGRSGLIANYVYRPDIDSKRLINVEVPMVVQKGDQLSGGKYIAVPTMADLVQKAGRRTVIATAKTVGLLLDRQVDPTHAKNCVTLFAGEALPSNALAPIISALGPFPSLPPAMHAQRDLWTTKALTSFLWKGGIPALSVVWFGEPDATEHETAPGSKEALGAIKSSDENLARVVAALDQKHARETTDIFVVSDHGFSTIERMIDLRKILKAAGFSATTEFTSEPQTGEIMLVGNGGTVLFYVTRHDPGVTRRLVEFLQQSDFAGVVFTKQPMEGTFTLDKGQIDTEAAPDVTLAFRWKDSNNQFGIAGMIDGDWQRGAGKGTHATLSRFDMHNTLIAAGPDFQRGETDETPSGNVDLAPTILRILGVQSQQPMDGRVLSEAMVKIDNQTAKSETETIEATRNFPAGMWRQTLQRSRVGSTVYLDEGNGDFIPKKPSAK